MGRFEGCLYGHQHQADEVYRHARSLEDGDFGTCIGHESDGRMYGPRPLCAITAASQFSPAVDFADLDGSLLIANDRFKVWRL